ncbi:MAG: ATP-binding cassette domain-containing protein, partial [Treponema sp.]|nr:ATP-binding cassette domain-containing protein [Treponema sp.]
MHPETASSPCVEMHGITKKFGTVLANDNASLSVNRGEILSLLGENGSGKTTLVNILAGIYLPDSGFVSIDRKECRFRSPHNAIAAGIGMVHQHYKLIPVMNVWENISLGNEHAGRRHYNPFIKKKQIIKKISAFEEQFGLKLNHYKKIYNMSIGEKQTVELLKLLFRGAQILILDEPTAVLTPQEIKKLFFMLRKMKQEGCAIIIITHKLNEVMEISDRVTVMRKGKTVETVATGLTNPRQLAGMMVGTSVSLEIERAKPKTSENPVLEVKNLCCRGQQKELLFDGISFNLYSGEILGLAGIAGGGQNELCETIAGIRKASAGEIKFHGEGLLGLMLRKTGKKEELMSYLPEDRLGMGLVGNMSIADN